MWPIGMDIYLAQFCQWQYLQAFRTPEAELECQLVFTLARIQRYGAMKAAAKAACVIQPCT